MVESTEVPVTMQNTHSEAENGFYGHSTDTDTKDSIVVKDSVVIIHTDSIKIVDRWHTKYVDRIKKVKDTVQVVKTVVIADTIQVPVKIKQTVVKEVEVNRLYWWQEALMWGGGIGILALAIGIIIKLKFK